MNPDLIKIIGIMFVVLFLIYLALKLVKQQPKLKEGLSPEHLYLHEFIACFLTANQLMVVRSQ